jgi:hypothetical protein
MMSDIEPESDSYVMHAYKGRYNVFDRGTSHRLSTWYLDTPLITGTIIVTVVFSIRSQFKFQCYGMNGCCIDTWTA